MNENGDMKISFQPLSKLDQYRIFISKVPIDKIDADSLLLNALKDLKFDELIDFFEEVKIKFSRLYGEFENTINKKITYKNTYAKTKMFSCSLLCRENFFNDLSIARKHLNEGNYIALLLSQLIYFKEIQDPLLQPFINEIIAEISTEVRNQTEILERRIGAHQYIPVEEGLFLFFIEEKEKALKRFEHLISQDDDQRRINLSQLENSSILKMFFERLGAEYIPKIDLMNEELFISLSAMEDSITKKELIGIIDKEDFFLKNVPLANFKGRLLNPNSDINPRYLNEIKNIFSLFFRKGISEQYVVDQDIGDIFFDNLTNPFPAYSDVELILARKHIIEVFQVEAFKLKFFGIIYLLFNSDKKYITNLTSRFPPLINAYFNDQKGYSKQTIRGYLRNDEKNTVRNESSSRAFLVKNTSLELN